MSEGGRAGQRGMDRRAQERADRSAHERLGGPLDRVDGPAKVQGKATYAGDVSLPMMVHAVMVTSTIPNGRIAAVDTSRAEKSPGVLHVMTHRNAPKLPAHGTAAVNPPAGRMLSLLQDPDVHYNGQPIGVVVALTFEQARHAASLLAFEYTRDAAVTEFDRAKATVHAPEKASREETDSHRGDAAAAVKRAAVRVDATYRTPHQHHNPMEPHATVAAWDGDRLTVHDATQYVSGARDTLAKTLGIDAANVRVVCPFVGGGFGCKGSVWSHVVLAAMAARAVKRPVKLILDRSQMFGPVGGRPYTEQHIVLAADREGTLDGLKHDVVSSTSFLEDWVESSAVVSRMLYAAPNASTKHRLTRLHYGTPTFQRAPGEASGTFALEIAMDELAYATGVDPLALRLKNHADKGPQTGKPWSSKKLRECYAAGAERFGWSRRPMATRSMREGPLLIGWGMATATYPANRMPAAASAEIDAEGHVVVRSGTQDLGTGTYTVMTQVAAETLGLPVSRVRFELGDTTQPKAPVSGGSMTVASVAPAVKAACEALIAQLAELAAGASGSPLAGVDVKAVTARDGRLVRADDTSRGMPITDVAKLAGGKPVVATGEAKPGEDKEKYDMHSFGATFVEVRVDADLGRIVVPRIVGAYAIGRPLNEKLVRSQLIGGLVWGTSFALFEDARIDPRSGRAVNANLAEYHVPVNADIGAIDVILVDENDTRVDPLGAKGVGEIGITGVPAAIANAIFHATGKRLREAPITLDRLL